MSADEQPPIAEKEVSDAAQAATALVEVTKAAVAKAAAALAVAQAAALAAALEVAQDIPLTKEDFEAQMQLLTERARVAGLNPIHTMARTYARQGLVLLDGLLSALENNADSSKKKK